MKKREFKLYARKILDPIVTVLALLGVPPLMVSIIGLALSVYGAVVIARGQLALGGVFLLLSGICDVLDGDLARRRGMASRFGAFLDSTLDRVAEFAFFGGFLYYLIHRPGGPSDAVFVITIAALTGSVMTSYARARAEGLGYDCTVGIMERPERIASLTLGLLLGYRVLVVILTVLAVATMYTFIQRIVHVRRVSAADDRPLETPTPAAVTESTTPSAATESTTPEDPTN